MRHALGGFAFLALALLATPAFGDDGGDCKAARVTPADRVVACTRFLAAAPPSLATVYAYYNRGISRRAVGDFSGAIADFDAIPAAHEKARAGYDDISAALGESMLTQALVARGDTRERMSDDIAALADYTAALARSPHAIIALRKRAPLLAKLGRKSEAAADYRDLLASGGAFLNDAAKIDIAAKLKALSGQP